MVLGTMPTRPALLIKVMADDGAFGWGEVWANFPPRANQHKAHIIEDVILPRLEGFRFAQPVEVTDFLRAGLSNYFLHVGQCQVFEHILAGLDTALWDLALRSSGQTFAQLAGLTGNRAQVYASSINPPDLERVFARHSGWGQKHFKLKLGFDDQRDQTFVETAISALPSGARLMVDSNQKWSLEHAIHMLKVLEPHNLAFSEEPMRADTHASKWEKLARETSIPLAGGENIYGVDRFLELADAGLQIVQPDVAKWGGVTGALELFDRLPDGIRLWPHFMGTALGQMASIAISAKVGSASNCEMDVNLNPLRTALCGDALAVTDGTIDLPKEPGLVTPPVARELENFLDK